MALLARLRSVLPWIKPAPVDPDSLGAILGAALDARHDNSGPSVVRCPDAPQRLHPFALSLTDWPIDNAGGLALICLAKQFCVEMGRRGFDPATVWDKLADLPPCSLDDLRSPEGWATLSALVSGGAAVIRLKAEAPHQEITRIALQFAHATAERCEMTPGAIYDALLSLPDDALSLVYRKGTWPDLERIVIGGAAHSANTH